MKNEVVAIAIRGVMPTSSGCALFLGTEEKVFVVYVDQGIGNTLAMAINKVKKERPLTHDLIHNIFIGLGVTLERVVINKVEESTFFARIILKMRNELGTKLVELDARPSDALILAVQNDKPLYVAADVLEQVEDMSEILERIQKQQRQQPRDEL